MSFEMKPTSVIIARLGLQPNGRVQKFFTNECARAMDKYVPFNKGNLADYHIEDNLIIYEQPYAKYQYYGMRKDGSRQINPDNRDRTKHPLATTYWDKEMWSAEGPDVVKAVQEYVIRGGK